MRPRPPAVRVAAFVAKALLFVLLGVAILVVMALLVLDTPPVRAAVAGQVSAELRKVFRGAIVIEHIGHLGIRGVSGVRARVFDPDGRQVIYGDGLSARVDTARLVRSLLSGGPVVVRIERCGAAFADVSIEPDEAGALRLAKTFEPRAASVSPSTPASADGGARITIEDAALARGWIHGRQGGVLVDADVVDAGASIEVGPSRLSFSVPRASIASRGIPAGADPVGSVTLEATQNSERPMIAHGVFAGAIGGIATKADARIHDGRIDAWVTSKRTPGPAPTLEGAASTPDDLNLRLDASGPVERLAVRVSADSGPQILRADATVTLSPHVQVDGALAVLHLDARRFAPAAPETDLHVLGKGTLELGSDAPRASFSVDVAPSVVSGVRLPSVTAAGTLHEGLLYARVLAQDQRGRARASFVLRPSSAGPMIDADAVLHVDDLAQVTRSVARGQADAFVNGTLDVGQLRLRAHTTVSAGDLSAGGARVGRAYVSADVAGELGSPEVDAALKLERLEIGERRFRTAMARVHGRLAQARFETLLEGESKAPSLASRGEISVGSGTTIKNATLTAQRDGSTVLAGASLVRAGPAGLWLERVAALGLGEPVRATLTATPRVTRISGLAPRVDLRRAARIAGLDPKRFYGDAGADIDVRATTGEATGHANVDLHQAVFGNETCGGGQLRAEFDGRRVDLVAQGDWNGGAVYLRSEGFEIDGSLLSPDTWSRARGAVDLSSDVDLEHLRGLVPEGSLPFEELHGRANIRLRFERDDSSGAPVVEASVRTHGLRLSQKGRQLEPADSMSVQAPSPWRLDGVDVDATLRIDPRANKTDFDLKAFDDRGPIVTVALDGPAVPIDAGAYPDEVIELFKHSPSHVALAVPRRHFADFPPPLARPAARGTVEVHAEANGTLEQPTIEVTMVVDGLASRADRRAASFGGRLLTRYSGDEATAEAVVTNSGRVVARADTRGHFQFRELLEGGIRRFDATAGMSLERFPLDALPILAAERVRGRLSGSVNATFGTDVPPALDGKLDASGVSVGRVHDNHISLEFAAEHDVLRASAHVAQKDGSADIKGTVPIALPFRDASQPRLESRPAEVVLDAKRFRLALLRPLAASVVSGLDGRIDGNVAVSVSDGGKQTTMKGGIRVAEGKVEIPTLGEEFNGIFANVKFERDSNVVIDDFRAEGTTGKVSGSGKFHLSGYTIDRASASASVPKSDPLPLSVGGELLADAWGDVRATLAQNGNSAPEVRLEVSDAGILLPAQSSHSLQALEPAERVRIGVMRGPDRLELLRGSPLVVHEESDAPGLTVTVVARDVEIRRGTDLRVRFDGEPIVKTGRDEGVYGSISLRDGFLDVQGKRFEIEKGKITFHGMADNPEVVVTAGWTAPEGTRVYADFVGPLKTGKLTLRSDPPHTNSEILSLVLFGTTNGNAVPASGGSSSSASAAAGIGGGVAAQGLNRALDDLTGLDVTARMDTSESANPRPELEVRVARDVTVALAHVLGVPPPGTNPDRNLATVNFRLRRNWSIETTFGDQGSSLLDLVWQYRY